MQSGNYRRSIRGGRGARFGLETSKRTGVEVPVNYGTTYHTVAEEGNYKIVMGNPKIGNYNKTPMESQTPNRIYGYMNTEGKLSSIVFMNEKGKRLKQIDWGHPHKGKNVMHVHIGIDHSKDITRYKLSTKEKRVYNDIINLAKRNGVNIYVGGNTIH